MRPGYVRRKSPAFFKPQEREVIELSIRHGLSDAELAVVLGMSSDEAHALASRARGLLEKALSALLIAPGAAALS